MNIGLKDVRFHSRRLLSSLYSYISSLQKVFPSDTKVRIFVVDNAEFCCLEGVSVSFSFENPFYSTYDVVTSKYSSLVVNLGTLHHRLSVLLAD